MAGSAAKDLNLENPCGPYRECGVTLGAMEAAEKVLNRAVLWSDLLECSLQLPSGIGMVGNAWRWGLQLEAS